MNIYIVTEGRTEQKIYESWIPLINANLTRVDQIEDVTINNFFLITGGGYPGYFEIIEMAISDVNNHMAFDRLVISVDSEDMAQREKYDEIEDFLSTLDCRIEIRIVVQHFCIEAWGLGNRRIIRHNTQSSKLRSYRNIYDVRTNDPEHLPANLDEGSNRAQFAEKYLRAALNDRYRNLTYTKSNPLPLLQASYFEQVRNRFYQTRHISSFENFLNAFI